MNEIKQKSRPYIGLLLILALLGGVAGGCKSSRKCGCGHDLNTVYKVRKSGWR